MEQEKEITRPSKKREGCCNGNSWEVKVSKCKKRENEKLLDIVDTQQEGVEQHQKRRILRAVFQFLDDKDWTVERLDSSPDKVIDEMYEKYILNNGWMGKCTCSPLGIHLLLCSYCRESITCVCNNTISRCACGLTCHSCVKELEMLKLRRNAEILKARKERETAEDAKKKDACFGDCIARQFDDMLEAFHEAIKKDTKSVEGDTKEENENGEEVESKTRWRKMFPIGK